MTHAFKDQGATNKGSSGCVAAFSEATHRAKSGRSSIGVRVTKFDIWFVADTRVALREGEVEIATIHCDGRIDFTH